MELSYASLQDLLGYFYDSPTDFTQIDFWKSIATVLKISDDSVIISLYTSQSLTLKIFKFLTTLPYKKASRKILKYATQYIDPSPQLLKKVIQQLVPCLQNQIPCLSTLNVVLSLYNSVFEQQTPTNENLNSHIYLYGDQQGILIKQATKWPFQKGGTISFWYNMSQKTKQCKFFEFMTQQKIGFQIVMKNRKIYIQKQQDDTKFRLIKNTSSYLCDAIFNKNVKLCIEFEIKKKFFQPYLSINLMMNNFMMYGVQIDSFSVNSNQFRMKMFKNFYGKFYASLILTEKLASQVDQLNNQKGFIYESDIRNFSYLFERSNQKIYLLFSAIRAQTQFQIKVIQDKNDQIQDQLKQPIYNFEKPSKTLIYDAIGQFSAEIGPKSCCYVNSSIGKQIGNYGGFQSFMPFLNLLQICCCADQLYNIALSQFLQLIKLVFENKADSIEKACHLKFFKLLVNLFQKTKMQGFSYEIITRLKQIYISLNTRMLREKYIAQVVWGLNFGLYLTQDNFNNYVKFIKTFYNEDTQSSLHAFDVTKIIRHITQNLDTPDCCFEHVKSKTANLSKVKNYSKVLSGIFQIVQNIFLIKRSEQDIEPIIKDLFQAFTISISPCFIQTLIAFLQNLFAKDSLLEKIFVDYIQKQNSDCRFYLYKCLSCCNSWKTKGKLIQFILKVFEQNFFEDSMKQREMLTLCARYPTMNYLRTSSIKSQQNRDSIEYSEDKLSLNSATMHKLIVINPIQTKDQVLLDDFQVIQVISKWAFSQKVLQLTSEDHQNPGLLILMELYKGSTYKLRQKISQIIQQKMQLIRFSPELMAWAIQCSLISQFDLSQTQIMKTQIQSTKQNFLKIICNYDFFDAQQQESNELSIIKLVFSSVKSKYTDDIVKKVGNKLFFIICDRKMQMFVQQLKNDDHCDIQSYDKLCWRVVSNVFTFMNEYYVIKGDGDEAQFDQDMAQILESQNFIIIQILQKILQIFVLIATINDRKIIQQANAERNHLVMTMIFPQKQKQKERNNIIYLIISSLQNIFQFFEVMDIQPKKKCLLLIKKYLIYLIQLTQNSNNSKIQNYQEQFKNIFLFCISFLQQRYHQYFYYPYDRHKNVDFQIQNRIRNHIIQLKRIIYTIFLDLIQLIQFIDQKGDLQHKSFYQLMKPKRKPVHRYSLKHIYPAFWKKADQKIIQFLCLKKQTLRKDAQQKLESYILLKKISQVFSNIQQKLAKKISLFVQFERKQSDARQKKSVNFYKITQSQKCRTFCQCQQQLTQFRIKNSEQQKTAYQKVRQLKSLQNRQIKLINKNIWNENRNFNGFWANKDFYKFSQNQLLKADNTLKQFYKRQRSCRQSKYFLMPFINIQALKIGLRQDKQETVYANQTFFENSGIVHKVNKKRTSEKIINGLQFIKKKVYSKIVKTITMKQIKQDISQNQGQKSPLVIENVLWIQPMKVYVGYLKIQSGKISYCHKSGKNFQHISLFKNNLDQSEVLIKQWNMSHIQGFIPKRFMLKLNSLQIYFKSKKSILLCFYDSPQQQFEQIILRLSNLLNLFNPKVERPLLKCEDLIKGWDKLQITQRWLKNQISNFQYLMCLNIASGRTYCDLNQYPIMPWIFSQYCETKVKKNVEKYRDFSKNTALLGKQERIKKFQQLFENINENHSDQFPIPHYFGFHYSNLGIILQYLIRLNPYSQGAQHLQGGKFDIPDRLFYSIPQSFKCATTQMSDLRELIPQFFYFPEFLINYEQFNFGNLQNQNKKVNNVELPDGCLNAYDFIQLHREGLQSKEVSANLHKWIDIIFGYKNSGKEAEKSMNTYHYLTNQCNSDKVDQADDPQQKEAMESQMAYYGKTPSQIFVRPHPQRYLKLNQQFQSWLKTAFSLNQNFGKIISNQNNEPVPPQILCLSFCEKTKTYCLFSKSGKGTIFSFDKQQLIKINQFNISFQKVQGIKILNNVVDREIPAQNLQCICMAVGGLWGGKLLIANIYNSSFDLIQKHTDTISSLKYSPYFGYLFSGSANGQLIKWSFKDKKVQFIEKFCCYSLINKIQIDDDLSVVAVCTEDGNLWILSIHQIQVIRVIKVNYPIDNFSFLQFPFYHLFIVCKNSHQYCYSINGTQIQQSEIQMSMQLGIYQHDCNHKKVLIRIGAQLAFLKVPELQIQQKLQVGIGQIGFKFVSSLNELIVINQTQMLVWRRPPDQFTETRKSI